VYVHFKLLCAWGAYACGTSKHTNMPAGRGVWTAAACRQFVNTLKQQASPDALLTIADFRLGCVLLHVSPAAGWHYEPHAAR
jgi:hypothetical protein